MGDATPYYEEDGITIYHGDCREILPCISSADVALVLTDPPYGINLDTDYSKRQKAGSRSVGVAHAPIVGDSDPFDPAHLLRFPRVVLWGAHNYAALLPPGGWFIWKKLNPHPHGTQCELAWTNTVKTNTAYESIRPSTTRPGLHPSEKPVGLMSWVLERCSSPGDLVLDPYMGSGPVAKACQEMSRRYIGIEIEERYCEIAVQRLAQGVLDFEASRSTPI